MGAVGAERMKQLQVMLDAYMPRCDGVFVAEKCASCPAFNDCYWEYRDKENTDGQSTNQNRR